MTDPATGYYSFTAPAGNYFLRFEYLGSANILPVIRSNGFVGVYGFNPDVTLVAGSPRVQHRELIPGAVITGTAVGAGGTPLESLQVGAYSFLSYGRSTFDPATGVYVLDRLPAGSYRIDFTPNSRWKVGRIDSPEPTVTTGQVLTGQDIVLAAKTTIEGRLFYRDAPSGVYPQSTGVSLWNPSTSSFGNYTTSGADGVFQMYDVTPGTYQVCTFEYAGTFIPNCWGDNPLPGGTLVTVSEGQVVSGIDIASDPVGRIDGRILARLSSSSAGTPFAEGRVTAYRLEGSSYVWTATATTQLDGTYSLVQLAPGQYRLRFSDDSRRFKGEYWDDALYFSEATDVTVVAGSTVPLADVILEAGSLTVSRTEGADRFEVGVNVSKALFPPDDVPTGGVPVVYIANGYNFPDALTAGPAASLKGGVVLLVEPTSIPPRVAAELRRLRPQRIVVAGGPASVSPAVFQQLASFVASPSNVFRAGGLDRYDASRTVVRDAFTDNGASIAIITTGENFPDALSAGPAAASQSGPVILVDGSATSIDRPTRDLLTELGIDHVYIAGGTGSVSPGIESSLKRILGESNVTRFAGRDRFEVGVLLRREFFSSADYTFVATGYKFPDALTGGPLAAAYGAPLFLSEPGCLPPAVAVDILDLDAQDIWLLGGPGSLSLAVENLQLC